MKIICGKYKNRIIPTVSKFDYRPSTTKFRAALFSILNSGEFIDLSPVKGAKVLDLFAGTGCLAFEALSRGAEHITLVDNNRDHLKAAEKFANNISAADRVKTIVADATNLSYIPNKYHLVFIDPPYYKNYIQPALNCLLNNGLLESGAIIIVESSKYAQIILGQAFVLVKEKIYGNNKLLILQYE
ncbi:MAG: RsmD family RNA methyltransferase [Rickettsiaceae bacterium]